jgi:hypothetical protein
MRKLALPGAGIAVVVVALSVLPSSAGAALVVIDQHRSVLVGDQLAESSPGDIGFHQSISGSTATAVQNSDLTADVFSGAASFFLVPFAVPALAARSVLDVQFTVSEATPFALTGQIGAIGESQGFFVGPGGVEEILSDPFAISGVLLPSETYQLHLSVGIPADMPEPYRGSWNFVLAVPEPTVQLLVMLALAALAAQKTV